MSQLLSQSTRMLLRGEQRLTPQLIQAMDILQLNAMALESRIEQEIDANPALELLPPDDDVAPTTDGTVTTADGEPQREEAKPDEADFERLDNLVREYDWLDDDEYRGTRSQARLAEEGDTKLEAMNNTAARPISLQEHLLQQWNLIDLDAETRRIGAKIIDFIDESGRLSTPLDQIAAQLRPEAPVAAVEAALRRVQQLDPPGIAARTIQESLLLQLDALPEENELARRIISEHLDDLERNRLPAIARALNCDVDAVKAAVRDIGKLSLHPGFDVVDRQAPPVVPDVVVDYNEDTDQYDVRLTRGNMREMRISPEFRETLEQSRGDKQAHEFIKKKIEAANAIIEAVRYRRERLLQVARAVVDAQRDFLDQGEQHMKVLRMSDLAAKFGCDPSTISRTVDEKYIQTPRGIYPLRRFFTGGAETDDGEALGWDSIRAKVKEIIDAEDKRDPLNDDVIVEKLATEGIEIKRRTVAKYRAQLNIPAARQRRQY